MVSNSKAFPFISLGSSGGEVLPRLAHVMHSFCPEGRGTPTDIGSTPLGAFVKRKNKSTKNDNNT